MSTFVLKHFPGKLAEEDYSYVSMAQQERYLLHLERDRRERIHKDDIHKSHVINQAPIGKPQERDHTISISKLQDPADPIEPLQRLSLEPAAQQKFRDNVDDDEFSVSPKLIDYDSDSSSNEVEGRSPGPVVAVPPLRVGSSCPEPRHGSRLRAGCVVSAMAQGTTQAWTWFHDLLFPRIYFRGRDLRR